MTHRLVTISAAAIGLAFALACGGGSSVDTSFLIGTAGGGTATCPAGAATNPDFADGTRVVLLAIHSDDAYAGSDTEKKLPVAGKVDGDLHNNGDCWFGGGFNADDGTPFYFYKAAFKAE